MGRQFSDRSFWLFFEDLEDGDGGITIETSLLPDWPEIAAALRPLGFKKMRNGGWRALLAADDDVSTARLATAAVRAIMQNKRGQS